MRWLVLILTLLLPGCVPQEMIQNAGEPTAKTASASEKGIQEAQLEAYNGPKARVAVYRFVDKTAQGGGGVSGYRWYNAQIGNGMADMLNDALLQSNRFIVLDREALKDILQEQDLGAGGRVSPETRAQIGQIEGAELLIKGAVTEFEPGAAGARAGGGLGGFGLPGAVIGGIMGGVRQSHVAMIVQVVDARTSRMLFSTTVEGKANDFDLGGALGGFGGGFGAVAGLGQYQKTPVEKAIRIAILQAVKEIAAKTPQTYFHYSGEGTGVASVQPQIAKASVQQTPRQPPKPDPGVATPGLPSTVIVKVKVANLRDVPGTQGNIVIVLKEGTRLSVQAEDKGWYFVHTDKGEKGWISKELTLR